MQEQNTETHLRTKDDCRSTIKRSDIVWVTKQKLPEPLSVSKIIVTTSSKGLLQFGLYPNFITEGFLRAKGTVEVLPHRRISVLVTKTTVKQQSIEKHQVMRNRNDDLSTIGSSERPQKSSQYKQPLPTVVDAMSIEKESSSPASQMEEQPDWRRLIIIYDEYSRCKHDFIDMSTPFQSLSDGHVDRISIVKHQVDLESPTIRLIDLEPFRAGHRHAISRGSKSISCWLWTCLILLKLSGPHHLFLHQKRGSFEIRC